MLEESSIIQALDELDRWQLRYDNLRQQLALAPRSVINNRANDLKRIEHQILYYQNLVRDMKRQLNPPKTVEFMHRINNP